MWEIWINDCPGATTFIAARKNLTVEVTSTVNAAFLPAALLSSILLPRTTCKCGQHPLEECGHTLMLLFVAVQYTFIWLWLLRHNPPHLHVSLLHFPLSSFVIKLKTGRECKNKLPIRKKLMHLITYHPDPKSGEVCLSLAQIRFQFWTFDKTLS